MAGRCLFGDDCPLAPGLAMRPARKAEIGWLRRQFHPVRSTEGGSPERQRDTPVRKGKPDRARSAWRRRRPAPRALTGLARRLFGPVSEAAALWRVRIGLQPVRPRLKIAPQQYGRKRHKYGYHGCTHHHCIKRHKTPLLNLEAFIPGREMAVFDLDQIALGRRVFPMTLKRRPRPRRAPDPAGRCFPAGFRSLRRVRAW